VLGVRLILGVDFDIKISVRFMWGSGWCVGVQLRVLVLGSRGNLIVLGVLGSKGNLLVFGFVYGKCSRLLVGGGAPRVIAALAGS
jgi:hypothetical protein